MAVRTLFPNALEKSLSLVRDIDLPPISEIGHTLVNELAALEEAFVLVVDDYDVIHERSVHDLLETLLRHPLRNLHLVLATRSDPPISLRRIRAAGQMSEIRMHDLRFTSDETGVLLERVLGVELDETTWSRLDRGLEGWAAGLRLASVSLQSRRGADVQVDWLRSKSDHVMNYLVREVLLVQAEPVRQFLLGSSLLDRFCAPLCDAVLAPISKTGKTISGKNALEKIERENLFVVHLDQENVWYRYHHLFQQLLRSQAKEQFSSEEMAVLHSRASFWLAENGFLDEALDHALASGDMAACVELVANHRHELTEQEQWRRLERWVEKLPERLVQEDPRLMMAQAWISEHQSRLEEAYEVLDLIESLVDPMPTELEETRTLRGEIYALRSDQLVHLGEFDEALRLAQLALELLPQGLASQRGFAMVVLSAALQMTGAYGRACKIVGEALGSRVLPNNSLHGRLLISLGYIHWMEGEMTSLKQVAFRCLEFSREFMLSESKHYAYHFLGMYHYQLNELAEAEKTFEAVVKNDDSGRQFTFLHSLFGLALCRTARNKHEDAADIAEQAINHCLRSKNTALLEIAKGFQAELSLRSGRLNQAKYWARSYDPVSFYPMYNFYYPELTLAKVLLAEGSKESLRRAEDLLSRIKEFLERSHNNCFLVSVLILYALLCHKKGDELSAENYLIEAVLLAQERRIGRPFLDAGPDVAVLLSELVKRNFASKFIGRILRAFRLEAASAEAMPTDASGESPASVRMVDQLLEPPTAREREILHLLAQRLRNREIADRLFIAPDTVKKHVFNICQKLQVSNRYEAVSKADALGLLSNR
jgi:LuxR family maltose regulon positive regulatory protein